MKNKTIKLFATQIPYTDEELECFNIGEAKVLLELTR